MTEILQVLKVTEWPDPRGFSVFVIKTEDLRKIPGPTLTTINPWKASLAKQALNQWRAATIEWRVFRGTQHELVSIVLQEARNGALVTRRA